jgi:hypothetical protein
MLNRSLLILALALVTVGAPALAQSDTALPTRTAEVRLVAPVRARPGQTIRIAVSTTDPALRRHIGYGVENLLQRRHRAGWRSIYHVPFGGTHLQAPPAPVRVGDGRYAVPALGLLCCGPLPIRLPAVRAGEYRLAKQIMVGKQLRWIYAVLRIRA